MSTGRYETANLMAIECAHWCIAHPDYGLTYQMCRFCRVSWPKVSGLYKYGVRHYICADCRQTKLQSIRERPVEILADGSMVS